MGLGRRIWERMQEDSDLSIGSAPYQTIVEISGDQRVLIENHLGVVTYGKERILVKVKFGFLCISGSSLEMLCMSRDQIVIVGDIHSVSLQRRTQG